MKKFNFKVQTSVGIHARNSLHLSKAAARFQSQILIIKDEQIEDAKNLMSVMTMRIKYADNVSFVIEGNDEEDAFKYLKEFCEKNL